MTWFERLSSIGERAEATNNFAYNPYVQKLYFKLLDACEAKDGNTAKKLIVKMGF
jgi:hypothetical protein